MKGCGCLPLFLLFHILEIGVLTPLISRADSVLLTSGYALAASGNLNKALGSGAASQNLSSGMLEHQPQSNLAIARAQALDQKRKGQQGL